MAIKNITVAELYLTLPLIGELLLPVFYQKVNLIDSKTNKYNS